MNKSSLEKFISDNALSLAEEALSGFILLDENREILFFNEEAEKLTGYKKEEMLHHICPETPLRHLNPQGIPLCSTLCPVKKIFATGERIDTLIVLHRKDGKKLPVRARFVPIKENGKVVLVAEYFASLDAEEKNDQEVLASLAFYAGHDFLTKLPNRLSFENFLQGRIDDFHLHHQNAYIIYMDIDDFKSVNDTFGHEAGDLVLKAVGEATSSFTSSLFMFSRLGGEEFGVSGICENERIAYDISKKILSHINDLRIFYQGHTLKITASLGLTMLREGDSVSSLLSRSDSLMYRAKHEGKNRICKDFD